MNWPEVPFKADGSVDFEQLRRNLWRHRYENGTADRASARVGEAVIPRNDPFFPDYGG